MFNAFLTGFAYPFRGLRQLFHPRLRAFVWLPILINAALFGLAFWLLIAKLYTPVQQKMLDWLPGWLDWLSWLVLPVLILLFLIVLFYGFTLVANVIASPFNGLLAQRVEEYFAPTGQPFLERPLWQEAMVAVATSLKTLGYYLIRILPLLLLFIIPVVNLVAPLIWGAACAWMLALQYFDYPLGNHGVPFAEQRQRARNHRWLSLGFGCGMLLMTLVPGLNFVSMPSGVIGATLMLSEKCGAKRRTS